MIKIWGPRPDPSPNFPGALAQAGLAPPPRSLLHLRHLPSALSEAGPAPCLLALPASSQRACSPDTCSTARSTASPQPSWLASCPLRAVASPGSGLLGAGPPCLTLPPREAGLSTPLCLASPAWLGPVQHSTVFRIKLPLLPPEEQPWPPTKSRWPLVTTSCREHWTASH